MLKKRGQTDGISTEVQSLRYAFCLFVIDIYQAPLFVIRRKSHAGESHSHNHVQRIIQQAAQNQTEKTDGHYFGADHPNQKTDNNRRRNYAIGNGNENRSKHLHSVTRMFGFLFIAETAHDKQPQPDTEPK